MLAPAAVGALLALVVLRVLLFVYDKCRKRSNVRTMVVLGSGEFSLAAPLA